MDKQTAKKIRGSMTEHLATLDLDGFTITLGNASFDDAQITFKLQVKEDGKKTQTQVMLESEASRLGLDLKKTVDTNGADALRLVDYKPRAPKMPFVAEGADGTKYKLTEQQAKYFFGTKESVNV